MKIIKLLLFTILLFGGITKAQIGINTTNPKTSLDVELKNTIITENTTPPGIKAPSLKLSKLDEYSNLYKSGQTGAFVYINEIDIPISSSITYSNITGPGYYFFDGSAWNIFALPAANTVSKEPWFGTLTNSGAISNTENIYQNAQVGIGFSGTINPNAQLEISSSSKGLLIPRLTKNQRDLITDPTPSLLIWNTDEFCFNFYKSSDLGWLSICENIVPAEFTIIECENSLVAGQYKVGTPTDNTNYIQININVTKAGSYNIEGTTTMGLFFQKSGNFPTTGIFTLIIPAYGSPTEAGTNIPITLSLNNKQSSCSLEITTIQGANVAYNIPNPLTEIISDNITKGVSTAGKKVTLKLNVTTEGITNITATDNNNYGIIYYAYNKALTLGENTVELISNGKPVPNTLSETSIQFTLRGLGQSPEDIIFTINVSSQDATATCEGIIANGNYVLGKPLTSSNTISLRVNVTSPGLFTFSASNIAANIKFETTNSFTTNGIHTITIPAEKINNDPIGEIGEYQYTSSFNGSVFCTFKLDIIYPTKKILLIGSYSNTTKALLDNQSDFGPKGKFKIEPLTTYLDINPNLTVTTLSNYINVQNYQMIIFPVTMGNYTIPEDVQQLLANFITEKKGTVIYLSSTSMLNNVKGLLDKLYPSSTITYNTSLYNIKSTILPMDINNKYISGPFGNSGGNYFLGFDENSWLGTTGTLPTGLTSLSSLKLINTNTARDIFIHTTNPGLFVFPGFVSLFDNNNAYGYGNPIRSNTSAYYNFVYNGNGIEAATLPVDTIKNYPMLGNVFAEYFKYLQNNFSETTTINSSPN